MANFGQRLRDLRRGRSQREVAESLGIPPTTLSSLESQENVPRGDVLRKLSDFFRVPITYFYPETETPIGPTDAAREYVKRLRQPERGAETIATQSSVPLDDVTRKRLAELIKRKNDQVSNK
jgi:transcriptional regulator with XRE-family HTH domain